MSTTQTDIVIIGAGLTGLSCAYFLNKGGADFLVLEKNEQVGGVIQTEEENGFTYEKGPNTGVLATPETAELFEELKDSCTLEIADSKAKKRLIWKDGVWNALPSGIKSAISTPLFTLKDKLRILAEAQRKKGDNPMESIAQMVERRLGKSFLDYAIDPFISGVYAGDPANLVTRFALPKLYVLEQKYGSFIKGSIQKKKEPKSDRLKKATREVFSAEGGLSKFTNAIADKANREKIVLSAQNISIEKAEHGFTITYSQNGKTHSIHTNKVVTTIGGYALPQLLPFIEDEKMKKVANLSYARIALVIAGYKKWSGIDINSFGGLVPSKEQRDILGVLFTSSFFKNRAPKNGALLSVFTGGARRPEIVDVSDEELTTLVKHEIAAMLKCHQQPDLIKIFRYKTAIPQYDASTEQRYKTINELQNDYDGLVLAGNIRDGIGMADRIKQGSDIAIQLMLGQIKDVEIL